MAKLNRIRIVLAEHDLNNKWLADKLGKDQATISKWVTNTTQPSLEALIAIANALEVPVQELVRQEQYKAIEPAEVIESVHVNEIVK